jgi:hypothetical protein
MKNTEVDQVEDKRRKQSLRKLDQDIKRIERLIKELLDGVDISELTTEKRLLIATRFMALHQRGIELRHTFELDLPELAQNLEMFRLMSLMRGEEIEMSDAMCIVDASDDTGPVTVYRESPGLECNSEDD